jgi:two-component system sensor histidine kinase AtoS
MSTETEPLIRMRDIHLSYGDTKALIGVDFDLMRGEIHALVGAHRAGKSSLVKLLSGAERKDRGEILLYGRPIEHLTPKTAIRNRIAMVYQHLNTIPSLNAMENIFAGQMKNTWYLGIDYRNLRRKTEALLEQLHFDFDITVPVYRLSMVEQHMVELARVLSYDPVILILDELSSKLTPEEMERIYPLVLSLKKSGKSIIYISHNMDEIFTFSDRVTILNEGRRMDTESIKELDRIKLINMTYSSLKSREQLNRENRELHYFKTYNEDIIKNIPVGVIILDKTGALYLINFAARKILDLENPQFHSSVENQPFATLIADKPLEGVEEILRHIRDREELLLEELSYGEEMTVRVSVLPFRDEDYTFLGTIILMEDISQDQYMREYLLRSEKIASIAKLAAGVAHEINNPLEIVHNYVELLKQKRLDWDGQTKLTKIEREVDRISKIVANLLSFSKSGRTAYRPVNPTEILDDVLLLLEHKFKEKKIKVDRLFSAGEQRILGDENTLRQLFMNLLINGVEAVPEQGKITVSLKAFVEQGYIEVSFRDNGCGIPEKNLERIFDPFFSTKTEKNNAGLGLSICQHIVELHRGLITCSSRLGKGSLFSLRFPTVYQGSDESEV